MRNQISFLCSGSRKKDKIMYRKVKIVWRRLIGLYLRNRNTKLLQFGQTHHLLYPIREQRKIKKVSLSSKSLKK